MRLAATPRTAVARPRPTPAGDRPAVPGYEVGRELGRGGMGVVHLARQLGPNRTVALKVMAAGLAADPEWRLRFAREARAMGRVSHPHVVAVFDAGEAGGRPFLAMEWVAAGSLADRLRAGPLAPRDAAAVVRDAARAVAAAHAEGVVHRDLKPANVLLAADGSPKVCDFGLARLAGDGGTTGTGVGVGTPAYMAPEQAGAGDAVGPAADVYGLGAVLYECLTGRPPFKADTPVATLLLVTTLDPVRPRLLQPAVPRDLETVALKCLEKVPARRYETVATLADDLARFLDGRPTLARPVGPLRRLLKWVRRRPAAAALVAVVLIAVAAGIAGGVRYTLDVRAALAAETAARDGERRATAEAERKRVAAERSYALAAGVFTDLDVRAARAAGLTVEQALAKRMVAAADSLRDDPGSDPVTAAKLRTRIAKALIHLGAFKPAVAILEQCRPVLAESCGPTDGETLTAAGHLAAAYNQTGDYEKALATYRDLAAVSATHFGPDHRGTLDQREGVAINLRALDRHADAHALHEDVYRRRAAAFGPDDRQTLQSAVLVANGHFLADRYAAARPLYEAVYAAQCRSPGPDAPETLDTATNLASLLVHMGDRDRGFGLYAEVIARRRARQGADHPDTLTTLKNYGAACCTHGRVEEGLRRLAEACDAAAARKFDFATAPDIVRAAAGNHERHGQPARAEPWRRAWLTDVERRAGRGSDRRADAAVALARNLVAQGRGAEAVPLLEAAVAVLAKRTTDAGREAHRAAAELLAAAQTAAPP